jgi:putative ABC transport system permease protein
VAHPVQRRQRASLDGFVGILRTAAAVTLLLALLIAVNTITATLSTQTVVHALALGVLTVAIAPPFRRRRIRRMNIPSALRVME